MICDECCDLCISKETINNEVENQERFCNYENEGMRPITNDDLVFYDDFLYVKWCPRNNPNGSLLNENNYNFRRCAF